jgi:hypothetical protein
MNDHAALTVAIAAVALLYATAGQAGGTAFLAAMALAGVPPEQMRPTALLLNVVAAGYATMWLQRDGAVDWRLLARFLTPALPAAFVGGLIVLDGPVYALLTALLLFAAAALMLRKRGADGAPARPIAQGPALLAGGAAGLLAGLTGIGGGVFLAPLMIALGWAAPRQAVALSPPFILANSMVGLAGALVAGERVASGITAYAVAALGGAALGAAIGTRVMSDRLTRFGLSLVLLVAGVRLLLR